MRSTFKLLLYLQAQSQAQGTQNQLRTRGLITGMSEIPVSVTIKTLNNMHYHFFSNFCVKKIWTMQTYLFTCGKGVEVFLPVSASPGLKNIEKLTPEELPRKNELTLGPDIWINEGWKTKKKEKETSWLKKVTQTTDIQILCLGYIFALLNRHKQKKSII